MGPPQVPEAARGVEMGPRVRPQGAEATSCLGEGPNRQKPEASRSRRGVDLERRRGVRELQSASAANFSGAPRSGPTRRRRDSSVTCHGNC